MKADMKQIEEQVKKYYDDRLKEHGFSPKGVGWKNEMAQTKRFEQMIRIIQVDQFSVNDLGCGTGDLFAYLLEKFGTTFTYTGYDLRQDMVDHANQTYAGSKNAGFVCIQSPGEMLPADYTIACGIFNLKYSIPETDWLVYIQSAIVDMFNSSRKGIAFNLLTRYADPERMEAHLYYGDPLYLFDYCKTKLSRNVALLHDYDEYDFTLLVKK